MKDKPISLKQFPEELYRKAKAKAVMEGISVPELFKKAVLFYLKQKGAKNGR